MKVATGVAVAGVVVAATLIRSGRQEKPEPEVAIATSTPAGELAAGERV